MLFIDRDGAAALSRPPCRSWRTRQPQHLEVVDGFQRLTTLTILLCALRDIDARADRPPNMRLLVRSSRAATASARPRLVLRETEEKFFSDHVRAPGATRLKAEPASAFRRRRSVSSRCATTSCRVLRRLDAAERQRLVDFLLDRCCVVLVATTGIDRAHRMFTVLNTTGKELARNDILKADLLGSVAVAGRRAVPGNLERGGGASGRRIREPVQPHPVHVRPAGQPGDRRRSSRSPRSGGAQGVHRGRAPPVGPHHGRHRKRPPQRDGALGCHQPVPALSRLALVLRLEAGGVGCGGRSTGRTPKGSTGSWPSSIAWRFGIRILGIGGSKRACRFGAVIDAIQAGRDVMG